MYNLEKYNKQQLKDIYKTLGNAYIHQANNDASRNYLIDIIKNDPETCYKIIRLRRDKLSDGHALIFLKGILSNEEIYNKYINNSFTMQKCKFIDIKLTIEMLPEKKLKRYINMLMKFKVADELKNLSKYNFGKEKDDIVASLVSLKILEGD